LDADEAAGAGGQAAPQDDATPFHPLVPGRAWAAAGGSESPTEAAAGAIHVSGVLGSLHALLPLFSDSGAAGPAYQALVTLQRAVRAHWLSFSGEGGGAVSGWSGGPVGGGGGGGEAVLDGDLLLAFLAAHTSPRPVELRDKGETPVGDTQVTWRNFAVAWAMTARGLRSVPPDLAADGGAGDGGDGATLLAQALLRRLLDCQARAY
jgi:hypothetical protein